MSDSLTVLTFVLGSYLVGSVPFGKIVGNLYGVDIQQHGSGNIGFATSAAYWAGPRRVVLVSLSSLLAAAIYLLSLVLLRRPAERRCVAGQYRSSLWPRADYALFFAS